jgi:dihydrofolate reductase
MRKLVVTLLMSLDGVVSAPERLLPLWDDEAKRYAVDELEDFDAFVFGRVTYQAFAARWPSVRNDEFADALNRRPKHVASRTLSELTWNGSTLLDGDIAAQIAELKRSPGKHLMKYGLGELDKTLLPHGLIDELRISLVPVVIGEGRHLLDGIDHDLQPKLELAGMHRFRNGILRLTYSVARPS